MFKIKEKRLLGYTFIDLFCGIGGFHLALTCIYLLRKTKDSTK